MAADPPRVELRDFFAGLTEYAFEGVLGIADPPMVDYLAELLTNFVRADALYRYRNLAGRRLEQVADMMAEANSRVGSARRDLHRHIGDFTLFWTGVYPEALPRLRGPDRKDQFIDYREQGILAYRIASTLRESDGDEECQLLERLSHQYDVCMEGLAEVRREWDRRSPGDDSGRVIIVQ